MSETHCQRCKDALAPGWHFFCQPCRQAIEDEVLQELQAQHGPHLTLIVKAPVPTHADHCLRNYGGVLVERYGGYVMGHPRWQAIGMGPLVEINRLETEVVLIPENPEDPTAWTTPSPAPSP